MKNILLVVLLVISGSLIAQTQHFIGSWTEINTTYKFDFDLRIDVNPSNQIQGVFYWKVVMYDENNSLSKQYYEEKLNLTAKEFVRGTYDPVKGEYILKGYKKDDPHKIIDIDTYHITLDKNGDVGGTSNAHGTGLGRINGKEVEMDVL